MRRTTVLIVFVVAVAALAACATMTVSYHTDRAAAFDTYMTYQWAPPDNLPIGDPRLDNNPFFNDFLQGTIDKRMAGKGYLSTTAKPDLLLHYHASVSQRIDVYETDRAYGYRYDRGEPEVVEFELGTIMLDIVDAKTSKVIWRGWVQDSMKGVIDDQDRLEKQVEQGIEKMMTYLPESGVLQKFRLPTAAER